MARFGVALLLFAVMIRYASAEAPKQMVDDVYALTEAAAVLIVCFESPSYKQLDTHAALQLFDLLLRLADLVERIANRFDDEALYFTFEIGQVEMSSDPELKQYVQREYQYCGESLFEEMEAYISEVESQLGQFLA